MALTAKEKAEYLVNKMRMPHYWQGALMYGHEAHEAKESALICADEIMDAIKVFHNGADWQLYDTMGWQYWTKVKEEITKL